MEEHEVSITRACGLMEIHRSYFYYKSRRNDSEVEKAIREASVFEEAFHKIFLRLRRAGFAWNHKKVYRVYKLMHYNKRSRLRKRLPARVKNPFEQPESPNTTWSMDFVSDSLECGRKFRVLNIIDDFNLMYTQPGHPTQNSYIERFNGSYRRAVLDAYLFKTLEEVRRITNEWKQDYNENRPHDSLGDMSPSEYKLFFFNAIKS